VDLRVEHKYLVPERLREALRAAIAPFVRPDRHATPKHDPQIGSYIGYTVRSIYFDTSSFAHFFANEDGLAVRAKPRIRGYDALRSDSVAFLEVKRRNGAVGSKARAPIPFASVPTLLETGNVDEYVHASKSIPAARANAAQFLFRIARFSLQPVVLVTYDREPHVGTIESSLRITLDASLRSLAYPRLSQLYADTDARRSLPGHFILEVKHDSQFGFPTWLRPFLSKHGLVRRALSKYYTCLTDQHIVQSTTKLRALARAEWAPTARRTVAPLSGHTPTREALPWIR
jgi:hypothetical protein